MQPALYDQNGSVIRFQDEPPEPGVLTSVQGQSLFREFRSLMGAMPERDDLQLEEGEDIYDRMLDDAHVKASISQLKSRILSKPRDVLPADSSEEAQRVTDRVREVLSSKIDLDKALRYLLRAITHKWAVVEVVWKEEGGSFVPDRLKRHPQDGFSVGEEGTLHLSPQGEPAPPFKFLLHVHDDTPTRPHGRSILQAAYWPWRFKQMGFEFWSTALDKVGVPSLAALAEGAANLDEVAQDLSRLASGSSTAMKGVESLKTVGGGGAGDTGFETYMSFCNAEISKAIQTSTLTMEAERGGRERGDTTVHETQAEDVSKRVARDLEETVTETIVEWVAFMEFGEQGRELKPTFRFDFSDEADWEQIVDAMEQGLPLSHRRLEQDYNLPLPDEDDPDDAFVSPSLAGQSLFGDDQGKKKAERSFEFAGRTELQDHQELTQEIEDGLDRLVESASGPLLAPIRENLQGLLEAPSLPRDWYDALEEAGTQFLAWTWLKGHEHVLRRAPAGQQPEGIQTFADFDVGFDEIPFEAAIEQLLRRLPVTREEFDEMEPALRVRAFTAARLAGEEAVSRLEDQFASALEEGETLSEFVRRVGDDELLQRAGFSETDPWHLETVYRTNASTAYNGGHRAQIQSMGGIDMLEYVAVIGPRTTDICRNLDGIRRPPGDPIWDTITPPNHFNERATIREIFAGTSEAEQARLTPEAERDGRVEETPPDDGFEQAPVTPQEMAELPENVKEQAREAGVLGAIRSRKAELMSE